MIERLKVARDILNFALDTYIDVCSAIQNQCTSGTASEGAARLEELVDCAANELLLFDAFKSKLKKAKAAMSVARNCSSNLVSIHALPSGVLSRIFQLVLDEQNCISKDVLTPPTSYTSQGPEFPKYPDLLSLVCYHWRQIAIGSTTLWSHIDIVPHHRFSRRLLVRAEGYAARAGQSLLDIHIADKAFSSESDGADVVQFLRSIAIRIRSIELAASNASGDFHHAILHFCFSHCVPGTFTQLSVTQHFGPQFIETTESPFIGIGQNSYNPKSLLLNIPQHTFEDIWLSLSSLRLGGLYPYWTSRAYHGLVELRLFPKGRANPAPITESHLVGILMASPQLQALYFNLEITEARPKSAPISPIHLDSLEVLDTGLLPDDQLEVLLRLIAPGANPLQLSFEFPGSSDGSLFGDSGQSMVSIDRSILSPTDEISRFLVRSNVSKLYVNGLDARAYLGHVIELLRLTPGLRVLALEQFFGFRGGTPTVNHDGPNTQPTMSLHLDHLYILKCSFNPDLARILKQILEMHTVQQLTLWDCRYLHDRNSYHDEDSLRDSISNIYPAAKFLPRGEPSPIEHWSD